MKTKYKILALFLMITILTAMTCMTMNISAATTTTTSAVTVTWGTNTKDYTSLANAISGINSNSTNTTYTIKLNTDATINLNTSLPNKPTIITAAAGKVLTIKNNYYLTAQANVTFKNITISGDGATLFGNGKNIVFGTGVKTTTSNSYVFSYVYGGVNNSNNSVVSNVIIYSGNFYEVYGGGYSSSARTTVSSANVVVYGGNIEYLFAGGYGANATVTTANTTIAGGNIRTVYAGGGNNGVVTKSNITYIGGNITNSITDDSATNAYGYLVADANGNYPVSPFKSNDYNAASKNLFEIGKGFTKANSMNFALFTMQVNFDSSEFTSSSLQYYDEASGTWKNWSANVYSSTGNYELRLRATGYAKDDTTNKNEFIFEQTVKFFIWDGTIQPLIEYIFGILFNNSIITQIIEAFTGDTSIINTILNWLFGSSGILNNISVPTSDIAFSNEVYDKLTNLEQWSGSFDDFMQSITGSSSTIIDEITDSNSKVIDSIKDHLNIDGSTIIDSIKDRLNIDGSTIVENIIDGLRKRYNP